MQERRMQMLQTMRTHMTLTVTTPPGEYFQENVDFFCEITDHLTKVI